MLKLKQKMAQLQNNKYFPHGVLFLISILFLFPLFSNEIYLGHDSSFHWFRYDTTYVAIKDGQWIPMINPNMLNGLGYAYNFFYGILPTYFVSLFYAIIGNMELSMNLFHIILMFLSGLSFYFFSLEFWKDTKVALLGAVIYMMFPYHIGDLYVRGAYGEYASFIFLPLLFHGLHDILNQEGRKWYLLTISTAGLILTHALSAYMCASFAFLYLCLSYKKVFKKNRWKKIIGSVLFGLLISAAQIIPLIEVKKMGDYTLFNTTYMGTNSTSMQKAALYAYEMHDYVLASVLLSIVFSKPFFFNYKKEKNKKKGWKYFVLFCLSILLVLPIIPWNYLPQFFSIIQFPWRYLMLTCFFFALLFPYSILTDKTKLNNLFLKLFLVLIFEYAGFYACFTFERILTNDFPSLANRQNEIVEIASSGGAFIAQVGTSFSEYLPEKSIYNLSLLERGSEPICPKNDCVINQYQRNGTKINFEAVLDNNSVVEFPLIYYPGYIVNVDGQETKNFETENGLLGVQVKNGTHKIDVHYRGTTLDIIAYLISLISFLTFLNFVLIQKRRHLHEIHKKI